MRDAAYQMRTGAGPSSHTRAPYAPVAPLKLTQPRLQPPSPPPAAPSAYGARRRGQLLPNARGHRCAVRTARSPAGGCGAGTHLSAFCASTRFFRSSSFRCSSCRAASASRSCIGGFRAPEDTRSGMRRGGRASERRARELAVLEGGWRRTTLGPSSAKSFSTASSCAGGAIEMSGRSSRKINAGGGRAAAARRGLRRAPAT